MTVLWELWSPLHFTGFAYEECGDGGAAVVEAWRAAGDERARASDEKKAARDQKKTDKLDADAKLVAAYVLAHPGCTVKNARANTVSDNPRRWAPAVERLGCAFVLGKDGCAIDPAALKPNHRPSEDP